MRLYPAFLCVLLLHTLMAHCQLPSKHIQLTPGALKVLKDKKILYVERHQYQLDHHNTETLFQVGEINEDKFSPGSALRITDINTGQITTLLETTDGVIRDPELSFDAKHVLFSMRKNIKDFYHIYQIDIDGNNLTQLTFGDGISDIDPLYLPDGGIAFSSSRQPKYCMCNRHIMCNLYRMDANGSNITQIGVSTLFEGHASLLSDGRLLYDRWEYIDRNFGDAQGLWTVNPDGTKHAIYYGNNTGSPGGVIDGRAIPGSDLVVCTFVACHDRPWGAIAILDRKMGIDGVKPVKQIWPTNSIKLIENGHLDSFKGIEHFYEDPYAINTENILASRTIWLKRQGGNISDAKMGIYLLGPNALEELILEGNHSLFDAQIVETRFKPHAIPSALESNTSNGRFYVQNVYTGTHMEGVTPGSVKYLRVIESPEKRSWTAYAWGGQGEQAPAVNWHSFETKRIIGDALVEPDGSVSFEAPAGKHLYFQLLDKNKKMIQSMRSGVSLMPGETYGCIGCHEDRLNAPIAQSMQFSALKKAPQKLSKWMEKEPVNFSFMEHVQPVLDKKCVSCHDFDSNNRDKLVLAKDMNPFFNAAYVNLHVKKVVTLIGGGPADIQNAYSWGSHASKLSNIIENQHHGIKLTPKEKEILYTWMDLNGVYYPVYESAFDNTLAGRCPLTNEQVNRLNELTGINLWHLNGHQRKHLAQISFNRPELSPCLDNIRKDKGKFNEAVAIIKAGKAQLKATPRGDIEQQLVPCQRNKQQLENYIKQLTIHQTK
ncbi:MAG: hypothetical protein ACRDDZ_04035 [Marinifilaceae bacterium]